MESIRLFRGGDDGKSFFIDSNIERMLLDTGAAVSQITYSKSTFSLDQMPEIDASGLLGSKRVKTIILPQLIVGSQQVCKLPVTLDDLQGILGMDFLGTTSIHLDLANDLLAFGDSISEGFDLFLDDRGHPFIQCKIDGELVWGLVDTGASVTIIDESFYLGHKDCFQNDGIDQGTDWTGAQQETQMVQITKLSVGQIDFENHAAAIVNLSKLNQQTVGPVVMIIGATTLELATWDFDFPSRRWKLEKPATTNALKWRS